MDSAWRQQFLVPLPLYHQGLGANQIAALSTDGVLFPKSIRNMSEISEVSELCPKFEHCFYRNIANF